MDIGEIVGWVLGITGILTFLGSIVALIFRSGGSNAKMEKSLTDLANCCQKNTESIGKLENRQEETEQDVAVLKSDNKRTTDSIIRLFDKIDKNHEVVMSHLIDLKGNK